MKVFIPVFFHAALGGLHSHVRAQVLALLRAGHHPTVMCKPGPFADAMADLGAAVLETDFSSKDSDVTQALAGGRFDLVHAHPFASRVVGLEVARRQRCAFVLTLHGMYTDGLESYADDVDLVITVSAAIRDLALRAGPIDPDRVVVLPNGVETEVFHPFAQPWAELEADYDSLRELRAAGASRRVLFASRMDTDKQFILDVVADTFAEARRTRSFDLGWIVVGDGTERASLEAAGRELNEAAGRRLVAFLGWLPESDLARLYNACHLGVAPGRSVLDCMACSTAVVAVGSKGYVGLVDGPGCLRGMYGNFGGFGTKHVEYRPGVMFADIDRVIYDDDQLAGLGRLSHDAVSTFYAQAGLDEQLLCHYSLCISTDRALDLRPKQLHQVTRPDHAFDDGQNPGSLSPQWSYSVQPGREVSVTDSGGLRVSYDLSDDDKFYISTRTGDFSLPPADPGVWSMQSGRDFELAASLRVEQGNPSVGLWLIEYDRQERTGHGNMIMSEGVNRLAVSSRMRTRSFKVAFRFSGAGAVVIEPIALSEVVERRAPPPESSLRQPRLPPLGDYTGENLIFIVGAPRSGTTWVLGLLGEHPDVVAATLDNLDVRLRDAPTLETNIFNADRPFTDAQIRYKFHRLSRKNPGQVVVEKTPIHLLSVDRIRRVFPQAALILVQRDGRDVVTSLVHVGRNPDAWWKGAPDTVDKATRLWVQYAEADLRCHADHAPLVLRYEELLADPAGELGRVLEQLGLSTLQVDAQIQASRDGRNIHIPGVFREGKRGSWRQLFTEEDQRDFERLGGELMRRMGYAEDT